MSQAALDYVENSPVVKALPGSEKLVMRNLAVLHNLQVNFAFAGIAKLTAMSMIGGKDPERQCRRILERLEKKGLVLRHMSVRAPGVMGAGSQTTNEYELPGMQGMAVGEEIRQQVFKTPRTRVAAQADLFPLDGGMVVKRSKQNANGSSLAVVSDVVVGRPAEASAVAERDTVGSDNLAVVPVEENEKCPGGGGHLECPGGGGQSGVSSLDVVSDVVLDVLPPKVPLAASSCGESNAGESCQSKQELRTTASAKATATTPVQRAARVSMERAGETSLSSRPGPGMLPRVKRDEQWREAHLDGVEAALRDEVHAVLIACGIAPRDSVRSQRNAIREQLRMYVAIHGVSIRDAGQWAMDVWANYVASSHLLWRVVGVKKFFQEGYWLDDGRPWDWDKNALAERKRRAEACIGRF